MKRRISQPSVLAVRHVDTNALGLQVQEFIRSPRSSSAQKSRSVTPVTPDPPQQLPEVSSMNDFAVMDTAVSSRDHPAPNGKLLTPVQHNVRRTSGAGDLSNGSLRNGDSSPHTNGSNGTNGHSQNAPPSPLSPTPENLQAQWSSAVGPAAASGKSGRVIERLMSENDKLRRELKEQMIKADDLQRNLQTCRPQIEALKAENDNLSHARGVDQSLISRRDRQIKDLKDQMNAEKKTREQLEEKTGVLQEQRDEAVTIQEREVQHHRELEKRATSHAEVLEEGFKRFKQETSMRYKRFEKDIAACRAEKEEDRKQLSKLEVVSQQISQEFERNLTLNNKMKAELAAHCGTANNILAQIREQADEKNGKVDELSKEMEDVVNQMRWVMQLKNNTELDESDGAKASK